MCCNWSHANLGSSAYTDLIQCSFPGVLELDLTQATKVF